MLASFRNVAFASLVLLASLGAALSGCSEQCVYDDSNCQQRPQDSFCKTPGECTVDGAPITCEAGRCTFDLGKTLKIPLGDVTSAMPDMTIRIDVSATTAPTTVNVLIDGIAFPVEMDQPTGTVADINWTKYGSTAKTLEVGFPSGVGQATVSVEMTNQQCFDDAVRACPDEE